MIVFFRISPLWHGVREMEILKLSAEGHTIKEFDSKLAISDRTIGNHRAHIFEKTSVGNISEMIRKASEYGIIWFCT